jgi:C-terminal processing protease CtpA/Prc
MGEAEGKEIETEKNVVRKIHEDVLAIYPFLTSEEKDLYQEKAQLILDDQEEKSDLAKIKKLLDLVSATKHADIRPKEFYEKDKFGLKPELNITNRIAYIKIPSWLPQFKKEIWEIKATCFAQKEGYEGIILDLRGNGGGNSGISNTFGSTFFDHDINYGKHICRIKNQGLKEEEAFMPSDAENFIDKPMVILINKRCSSSCLLFSAPFKVSGRATFMGQSTEGGSGWPVSIPVNIEGKDYIVRIPSKRFVLKGEDKPIEEAPIRPDIVYTESDIVEFAKKYLLR